MRVWIEGGDRKEMERRGGIGEEKEEKGEWGWKEGRGRK